MAIVLCAISLLLPFLKLDQSVFATFPGENGKIVFASTRDGNFEIYVMNADVTNQQRLTSNGLDDIQPNWSPDGTKIVFSSTRPNGYFEILTMNADSYDERHLTNNPYLDVAPNWSPDDNKIAFETDRDDPRHPRQIYIMDADGSDQHNISNNPDDNDLSPNCGTATDTEPEDTTSPVITIPEDTIVEATGPDGATVSFEVTAEDDVDGPVDVTYEHNSGDTFPIGETVGTCSAEDLAGNRAEETFTMTVQDTTASDIEITQVVDRRNGVLAQGDTTPTPYIRVTFEATDAVGVEDTVCSLDGQGFTLCTSPVVYDRLSRGTHQVTVRATDEAGNIVEDQFTWTVCDPSAGAPGR